MQLTQLGARSRDVRSAGAQPGLGRGALRQEHAVCRRVHLPDLAPGRAAVDLSRLMPPARGGRGLPTQHSLHRFARIIERASGQRLGLVCSGGALAPGLGESLDSAQFKDLTGSPKHEPASAPRGSPRTVQ